MEKEENQNIEIKSREDLVLIRKETVTATDPHGTDIPEGVDKGLAQDAVKT